MKNQTTANYLLTILNSTYANRSDSIIQNILDVCIHEHVDIFDLIISQKFDKVVSTSVLGEDKRNWLQDTLSNWHLYENRLSLRQTLESNIPRQP